MGEKLPSLGTEELIPEEPANVDYGQSNRADIQHRREQERDVRGAAKTIAQLALEISHVHRLAALITEKADLLKDLAMRWKSYQDEVKESSKGKSTAVSSAPKKQRTTGVPAPLATPLPAPLPTAHGGKAMEVDTHSGTSQPSGAPFPYPFTHTPSLSGAPSAPSQPEPPSACVYIQKRVFDGFLITAVRAQSWSRKHRNIIQACLNHITILRIPWMC